MHMANTGPSSTVEREKFVQWGAAVPPFLYSLRYFELVICQCLVPPHLCTSCPSI
jgi:hypothetical protein